MTGADVVLVTETHYPPDYNPSIKNFNLICSATRKDTEYGAFGGSAIFVRKSPQIVMNFATISSTSDDCTIAHSMINYTNFVLIYRSPNQAKCDMKKLMNYLRTLKTLPNLIIVGDLNLRDFNWELMFTCNADHKEAPEVFNMLNVKNFVNEPTHNKGGSLDVVLNDSDLVTDVQVWQDMFPSDHFAISFNAKTLPVTNPVQKTCYMYDDFQKERYNCLLGNVDWSLVWNQGIDDAVKQFSTVILETYRTCLPTKVINQESSENNFSFKTMAQINLCKDLKKRGQLQTLQKAQQKLQELLVIESKKKNEKLLKYLSASRNNIFKIFSSAKCQPRVTCTRRPDGTKTYDPQEIASILSQFYASVFLQSGPINLDWDEPGDVLIQDIDINHSVIANVVSKAKRSYGTGPDFLSTVMLKEGIRELLTPMMILFRRILDSNYVPENFKMACVVPIPKKLDSSQATNTRGICKESVLAKVLEKIIYNNVYEALESVNYFPDNQYGFRKGRGCETNLTAYHNYLHENLNNGYFIVTCFADLSKSFDLVDHSIVLDALHRAGVRGKVGKYFEQWMTFRKQFVRFQDHDSETVDVTSSIVQGSNLSTLLFLILKTTLNSYMQYCEVLDYCDDTKVSLAYKTDQELYKFQCDINGLLRWTNDVRQKLNPTKTVILSFGRELKVRMWLNRVPLNVVDSVVDLGLLISAKHGLKLHQDSVYNRLRAATRCAKISSKGTSFASRVIVWSTFLRPLYTYCSSLWSEKRVTEKLNKCWVSYFEDTEWDSATPIPNLPNEDLLVIDIKRIRAIYYKCESLLEFRRVTRDILHIDTHRTDLHTRQSDKLTFVPAAAAVKHSWPALDLLRRAHLSWNIFVGGEHCDLSDAAILNHVRSAENPFHQSETRARLENNQLLSWHKRCRIRDQKLQNSLVDLN